MRRISFVLSAHLIALATPAQQGHVAPIGGAEFVAAQSLVETATGIAYTGMLGLGVDNAGHYYVSSRRDTAVPASPHKLFEFDANGTFVAAYDQPAATAGSSWGIRDMALDPATNVIYGGLEGPVVHAFDAAAGRYDATKDITIAAPAGATVRALAFDGTHFLTADFGSPMWAFDRSGAAAGAPLPSVTLGAYGLAHDPTRGTWWVFSQRESTIGPRGASQPMRGNNAIEVDANGDETGHMFTGDHVLDGVAGGAELVRLPNGDWALACLTQGAVADGFYLQLVHAEFGAGCGGQLTYVGGGNAWAGNAAFAPRGSGLDDAAPHFLLIGIDAGPTSFGPLAACASNLLWGLADAVGPFASTNGSAAFPLPIPPGVPLGAVFLELATLKLPVTFTNGVAIAIIP
jgi:hypothetical protein